MFNYNKKLFNNEVRKFNKKRDITYSNFNLNIKKHFSGSSPPEVFIGRYNYPDINAGILSPESFDKTEEMSSPEIWHEKRLNIADILLKRQQLIYGRFKTKVNMAKASPKLLGLLQEISMAYKSVSTEFFLKKIPRQNLEINNYSPIIGNPAPLENARLQENPKVKRKVEYLVYDTDNKAVSSISELYSSEIPVSNIIKVLSAGLLGLKTQRKLVPTRWSITAVDDIISKQLLKKIRYYKEINEIQLYNSEYNGNHYEIMLLPDKYSFEVIEGEIKFNDVKFWYDYESFHGRRFYADNVVGAYYACRLALAEYLENIKKQATAVFFREVRPEYYAPLGVGILRECTREAFKKIPERFNNLQEALEKMQSRMKLNINLFIDKSMLLNEYGKQTRLNNWLNI